ncbi:hypothetical protein KCU70_g401, partial [Aureobasidium melanogenum]
MEITSFTRSIVHFYSYTDYFWHTGRYLGDICYRLRIILCIYCLLAFYKGLFVFAIRKQLGQMNSESY